MDCWWLTKIRSYCRYRYGLQVVSAVSDEQELWPPRLKAPAKLGVDLLLAASTQLSAVSESPSTPLPTSTPKAPPKRRTPIFTTSPASSKHPSNTNSIQTSFACNQQRRSRAAYQPATRKRQRGREASRGDREDCAVIAEANTLSLLQSDARAIIGTATRRRKPS